MRLVIGPAREKAGYSCGVMELRDRLLNIHKHNVANGIFVNDMDGSFLFSGNANPLDYRKRERMITVLYKEFFGVK